ncbi:MAG TPA: YceI family protein [Gemmatimonadales bacterium]|nr:YceI family protein [Gemmatimonadales bacterium]
MLSLLAAFSILGPARAPVLQEYAIDAGHSIVEFSIGFAFSRIKGRFTQVKGTILYDSADVARSSVTVIIETNSLDTGWPHRDEHLRTSDFFDVERFPTITFQSEQLTRSGVSWLAEGPLTMHGVTRRIVIPFRFPQPPTRSPESRWMLLNATGALRLARKDFGILGGDTFNSWFNRARSATMSDSVDIELEIEGWLADAASQRSQGVVDALERIRTGGVDTQLARWRSLKQGKTAQQFAPYFHGGDLVTRALIADRRVPEAVALSRGLTELFPELASAYLVHGYALTAAGNPRAAGQQFARAREVFKPPVPDPAEKFPQVDPFWYYNDERVRTSLEWGRVNEAVLLARALTEIYPGTARAHTTYGLALATSGDSAGAAAAYARALELDPRETRALEWKRRLKH